MPGLVTVPGHSIAACIACDLERLNHSDNPSHSLLELRATLCVSLHQRQVGPQFKQDLNPLRFTPWTVSGTVVRPDSVVPGPDRSVPDRKLGA